MGDKRIREEVPLKILGRVVPVHQHSASCNSGLAKELRPLLLCPMYRLPEGRRSTAGDGSVGTVCSVLCVLAPNYSLTRILQYHADQHRC